MSALQSLLEIPGTLLIGAISVLDALPDYVRALLTAALLVVFVRFIESRIAASELQFGAAFRKAALVALTFIPLIVWLFPSSRFVVFVDDVPASGLKTHPAWLLVPALWAAGTLVSLVALVRTRRAARRNALTLPLHAGEDRLDARLAHWQRRLGFSRDLTAVVPAGIKPEHLPTPDRITFPRAALHWPVAVQDVVIIQSLCHLKLRHRTWDGFAQLVSCLYWPFPSVQALHRHLLDDFQAAAFALSRSCYADDLGYDRALRQARERLAPPAGAAEVTDRTDGEDGRFQALHAYRAELARLLEPQPGIPWMLEPDGEGRDVVVTTDPYQRVFLTVGQAAFFAFLLTGVTLRETPPDIEPDYSFRFDLLWKDSLHRYLERAEGQGDQAPPRPGTPVDED